MTWPTHTLLGMSTLWLLVPLPPDLLGCNMGTLATFAALGALLPDLDATESKIKHLKLPGTKFKPFLLPAHIVNRTEVHRGLLHSLAGLGIAALMVAPFAFWVGWAPVTALLLGYASHLLGDAATKNGVRLLYPKPARFHLLPQGGRLTTGSLAEDLLTGALLVLVLPLLLFGLFSRA